MLRCRRPRPPPRHPDSMRSRKTPSRACSRRTKAMSVVPQKRWGSLAPRSTAACRSTGFNSATMSSRIGFSRFRAGVALRITAMFVTIVAAALLIASTQWYVVIALLVAAAFIQAVMLAHFATRSSREMARLLDAIAVDDTSPSFSALRGDSAHSELGTAMARVLTRLRAWRSEHEEQAHYLQALVAHVPVALVSVDERGKVQLLNTAARRLFETALTDASQFSRHGHPFAVGIESL